MTSWQCRVGITLAFLGITTLPSASSATWPSDPNVNVALCTANGDQDTLAIVSDGAGGAIVTWHDYRGTNPDIYAQRVSAAGVPLWTADGVALCSAAGAQLSPTIISDGAGGAIVTWHDYRGTSADIYAQRVSAAGVPQWTTDGVALCTAAAAQLYPSIDSDGAGGAIVTWQDPRNSASSSIDIYAQRVSTAGVPQWTANGVALCTAGGQQVTPTIVSDGKGGAIVTWQDRRTGLFGKNEIYAQRVSATGVPQWTAGGVAICTANGDHYSPALVSDGAGGAIVTWYDTRSLVTAHDIYAQRVSAAGVPQWTTDGVGLCTSGSIQIYPAIVSDGAGGAIVTWADERGGPGNNIYAQRVSAAGVPQWTADGVALCAAAGAQSFPDIAPDGAGGAIVTWYDNRSGFDDIYAQRVSAAGVPQWTADGVALCTAANHQRFPTVLPDGCGGAIVAWHDYRSGTNYDIYAQRIGADGTLGGDVVSVQQIAVSHRLWLAPNPARRGVFFGTPAVGSGKIEVLDLTGRRVWAVVVAAGGVHWYGATATGEQAASGVYLIRFTSGTEVATQRLVWLPH